MLSHPGSSGPQEFAMSRLVTAKRNPFKIARDTRAEWALRG